MSKALLEVSSLHAHYGQGHILQGVSLQIGEGEVLGLLGRNGAGKTTTLKTIMGIVPASGGEVLFGGLDITAEPAFRVARLGIGYVPEDRGIFPSLSVHEHLTLAKPSAESKHSWSLRQVLELFPRLDERRSAGGAQLSGGEQQMLAIARALLLNPRLLVLDEPSEGLAPVVIEEIGTVLDELKQSGMTILLVEQNYALATRLCDRIAVLGKGRVRWTGEPHALESEQTIKHTWLGI